MGDVSQWSLEWYGRCTLAPSTSIVKLQIWNVNGSVWEDVDTDNVTGADTDFTLTGSITVNASDYKDAQNIITCRIYQNAL